MNLTTRNNVVDIGSMQSLSSIARDFFGIIAEGVNFFKKNLFFYPMTQITKKLNVSKRQAMKARKELEDAQLISHVTKSYKNKCHYSLNFEQILQSKIILSGDYLVNTVCTILTQRSNSLSNIKYNIINIYCSRYIRKIQYFQASGRKCYDEILDKVQELRVKLKQFFVSRKYDLKSEWRKEREMRNVNAYGEYLSEDIPRERAKDGFKSASKEEIKHERLKGDTNAPPLRELKTPSVHDVVKNDVLCMNIKHLPEAIEVLTAYNNYHMHLSPYTYGNLEIISMRLKEGYSKELLVEHTKAHRNIKHIPAEELYTQNLVDNFAPREQKITKFVKPCYELPIGAKDSYGVIDAANEMVEKAKELGVSAKDLAMQAMKGLLRMK